MNYYLELFVDDAEKLKLELELEHEKETTAGRKNEECEFFYIRTYVL